MMGKKLITQVRITCPQCGGHGQVKSFRRTDARLVMICEQAHEWISECCTCPKCGQPNGYLADGTCLECYTEIYEERGAIAN
ncbi:hypothetical protein [Pelorhabdus rhamnosifermentans]|uniref:hypothetical protein n=1 Tax=Pelorhabdus rhamnosifermentans TaxID=2772457 RepID=UPI001C05F538|nr:hypothetical protein [Pelorhabdus rhamnosifermentans]